MNTNFVKIMDNIESIVKSCKCYVEYGFVPKTEVITVMVFKNDGKAEFNENREYENYILEAYHLFAEIINQCNALCKDIRYYTPSDLEKYCNGGFEYRGIYIIPNE